MVEIKIPNEKLKWFLPILSGIFIGIGFIFPQLSFLIWLSFLPLLFFLNFKGLSSKKAFLAGLITGVICAGLVMSWLFDMLPLSWMGIKNPLAGFFIVFFYWFLLILIGAFFIGLFSLSYHYLKRGKPWSILIVPSLWIIYEYLRTWAIGILFSGKESLFGAHWTFGNLAYATTQNPSIRLLAGVGGIYLISFLVIFVNVVIFLLFKKLPKSRFPYFIATLFILGLLSASYFVSPPQNPQKDITPFNIAILQTKFPSFFYQTEAEVQVKFNTQAQLLSDATQSPSDNQIIVFPEDSRFLNYEDSKEILAKFFPEKEILIVDSSRTETEEGIKSIATFYNAKKGSSEHYQKLLLAPLGEYLPYIIEIPGRVFNKNWVEKFEKSRGYKKGERVNILSGPLGWQGSALFCSETLSPDLHRQMVNKGAEIFFNLASLSFTHGSGNLDSQIMAMLQIRAAENNRYLVRATNFGTSYIINNRGEIIKKTPNFGNQVLSGQATPISKKTLYARFGDWILIFALGVMAFLIFKNLTFFKKRGNFSYIKKGE